MNGLEDSVQLALPVWFSEDQSFESFVADGNEVVIKFLTHFICGKSQGLTNSHIPFCLLHSLHGAGKSHLLYASCQYASENNASHAYFDLKMLQQFPASVILDAQQKDLICIDNIHIIKDDLTWQIAIFDLLNKVIEKNQTIENPSHHCKVLITASQSPTSIGLTLSDLVSRLSWGTVFKLDPLNDEKSKLVIRHKLSEKGLEASDDVLNFLVTRLSRNITKQIDTINLLDRKSLESKRKLTIPFVKQVLNL
jgi:DnaA family protein